MWHQAKRVWFYGNIVEYGYDISYILLDRKIAHNFVYIDDYYILSIEKVIEITGPKEILFYLKNYKYVSDLYS